MEENKRKGYGRALAIFLIVMLACTAVSRAADSMSIPRVTVQKAQRGRITYSIKGRGTLEAAEKTTYLVPEGCLVEECLESGTRVQEGDVLVRFQMEYLEKRKAELEQAWQESLLALEQAELNRQEDAWIPAAQEAGQSLEAARAELNQAEAARNVAQEEYDRLAAEYGRLSEEEARQGLEAAGQALEEASQRVLGAAQALDEAEKAYQSAENSDDVTRRNNAKAKQAADLNARSAGLAAEAAEQKVRGVQELLDQEGRLCAREAGIFLNTSVTAGAVTSGSEFISIGTGGLCFTAELPTSDREKLAVGDEITVKLPGRGECKAPIAELTAKKEAEEGQEALLLKAMLPEAEDGAVGQASFSFEKKSEEKYTSILPLAAIRQDSRGYYCLAVRTQSSILGEEQRAEEIRLTLLDQDGSRAAVEGAILEDTRIIVSSEKQVRPEDRVKVEGKVEG